MLAENARIMMDRINGVAEPDVNVFNVAMPEKPRLSVFEYICPLEVAQTEVKTGSRKTAKRKRKHSAHGIRDWSNHAYQEWDEEIYYNEESEFAY